LANDWILSPTRFADEALWISLLVVFIILVTSIALAFLALSKYVFKLLLIFLIAIPFFFFFKFSFYYLLSVTLMFWLLSYAIRGIRIEAAERNKINIKMILRRGLSPILTAFFIMISFAYFMSPVVQSIAQKEELPPTFNQAVREVFTVMFKGELEELPPAERRETESQVVSEVVRQANEAVEPFFGYLPPVVAFGLFLVLQGLSFVFIWPAIGLGIILFGLLKKIGFFRIKEVQVKSEILEI
jgi:hypothetical protein